MKGLDWMASQEDSDGVARVVDVNNVESETKTDDLEQGDLSVDNANADSQEAGVSVSNTVDISIEELGVGDVSGEVGAKTIEAFNPDERSNSPKRFVISGFDASNNPAAEPGDNRNACVILLQNGTLPDVGVNGVTVEDLLKISEEVFVGYQEGQFACEENDQVLFHLRAAQAAMQKRFQRRREEGTEGTHEGH